MIYKIPAFLIAFLLTFPAPVSAAGKINVVASFSILDDLVRNVGGERVSVTALVGPDGDAHVFTPAAKDAQAIRQAQLVVINGLGFEGWINRLMASAGFKGTRIVASHGVEPIAEETEHAEEKHQHSEEGQDPHAWQSVKNAKIYVANIRDGLIAADPAGKAEYEANAQAYLAQLDELDIYVRQSVAKLPAGNRTVITSHDAFGYFGHAYGLKFVAPQGISEQAEPSAEGVAALISQIKVEHVKTVFVENISNGQLLIQIARESGAKVGGRLYSDALSPADGPAPSYIQMVQYNIRTLTDGLK
jgi:zinc/manganese transport system substrate-binding protein